jgi:prepilin-type N-terminal cleavage/methylation domain-containing protein/prepilin-type processing-associated H-X9-DG protein
MPYHSQKSAFTLIELLTVVAIIGLLIAILLPALSQAREQSKGAACLANLRSFGTGFTAYATANRDYLCSGQADARPGMNLPASVTDLARTGIEQVGWIADLVRSGSAFPGRMLCPSNPGRQIQSWGRALALPGGAMRYTPERFRELTADEGYNTNYCQSWFMAHGQYDGATRPVVDPDRMQGSMGPLRTTQMSRAHPARVPLLGDGRAPKNEIFDHAAQGYGTPVIETKSVTDGPYWQERPDGSYAPAGYTHLTPYGIQDWDDFGPAHRPRASFTNEEEHTYTAGNILFGDGHAATFEDRFDFDNGQIAPQPDGELDSWDLRDVLFDGVLTLGRRSASVSRLE